jgi:hypothetical protein
MNAIIKKSDNPNEKLMAIIEISYLLKTAKKASK